MTPAQAWYAPDGNGGAVWNGDPSEEPFEGPDWQDYDYDGLPNWLESYLGTNQWNPDSDYDGIYDGDEVNITGTNPTMWDTNWNGYSDGDD